MILLCLIGLVWPRVGWAVTTVTQSGHLIRTWQTEDGLPQNTVMAITQTRDGYLWVGTLAGLARFDGLRFRNFDAVNTPSLRDERISSLYEDTRGTLWVGHESGDVTCYRDGRFEAYSKSSHSGESVYAIAEDDGGVVWLFRQNGTLERAGQPAPNGESPVDNNSKVLSLAHGRDGRIWFSVAGVAAELKAGVVHPLNLGPARYSGYVRGLAAANDGNWWVVRDQRIRKWAEGRWTEDRGAWGNSDISTVRELRDGVLAVGTMDSGFHLFYPDGHKLSFDYNHGNIQSWVRLFYEDREGNLWVAAGSGGLALVRPTPFDVLNAPDNWQGRTVLSVAPGKNGSLWIGTEGAGVYHYRDREWTHYGAEGFANPYIWSLAVDADGKVWAGTWDGGVYRLEGERFTRASELDPIGSPVMALQFDAMDRSLWVGTRNGLLRWRDGEKSWYLRDQGGKAPMIAYAMRADAHDTMWLALAEAGVGRFSKEKNKMGQTEKGWPADTAQCLLADGDTLWIGTQKGGLFRLKNGRFSSISLQQGLASRVICHIEEDGQGFLWLSTHHGIVRVSKEELNRCADGEIATVASQTFDKDDGLPTLEYSGGLQAAGCRTPDGRLWFTSNKGLVSVDPAAFTFNVLVPPVVVESLLVDGRILEATGSGQPSLKLRPAHERIEFRFTALSLAAPSKVLFKYQLEGLDQGWIEAGDKRTAFYSHLPPGEYRFHVIACNNDGVWNPQGDTLPFTVEPFYWQTWWFRSLVVLSAVASVGLIVRSITHRRMQMRLDELEHERGIERERSRIAQDIHDDIGTSMTRITMLSQTMRAEMAQPARASAVLDRIHETALEVTHTLDEIVWAVNPRHDTLDSLVNYISRLAQETLADAGIACRIDLPINLPPWPLKAQARHNLLLAFKEVLNNILKHAKATEVHVSLVLRETAFVLSVQDNGPGQACGKDAAASSNRVLGGNGLENISRRLAQIGGRCEMQAAPGQGWCVVFIVEASPEVLATLHPWAVDSKPRPAGETSFPSPPK